MLIGLKLCFIRLERGAKKADPKRILFGPFSDPFSRKADPVWSRNGARWEPFEVGFVRVAFTRADVRVMLGICQPCFRILFVGGGAGPLSRKRTH